MSTKVMKDSVVNAQAGASTGSMPVKQARLSVAERAYVRGMVALKDRRYAEAHRQLSGYLKLTENKNRRAALICEVLSVYLAIGREIAIIETKVG